MSHETACTRVKNIDEVNLADGGIDLAALRRARDVYRLNEYSLDAHNAPLDTTSDGLQIGGKRWEVSATLSRGLVLLKCGATYMLVHADIILPTYAQATFAIDPHAYDGPLISQLDEQRIEAIRTLLPWVKAMEPQLER